MPISNSFVNLDVPGLPGTGVASLIDTLAPQISLIVGGELNATGEVVIDISGDGVHFAPATAVFPINNPPAKLLGLVAVYARVRRISGSGAAFVSLGAATTGLNLFGSLQVTPLDTSAMGPLKTLIIAGSYPRTVVIEGSNDGVKYDAVAIFSTQGSDLISIQGTWMRMRIRPTSDLGSSIVFLGAGVSSDIGGGGGGGVAGVNPGPGITVTGSPSEPIVNNIGVLSVASGAGINVTGPTSAPVVANTGVLSVNPGTGMTVTGPATAPVVNNTGVLSVNPGTGMTVTGPATAPVVNNTGVLSVNPGAGMTVTGPATAPVVNNAGVLSVNGQTGVVFFDAGADWSPANTRIYAVDFVNGNDAHKGFADPTGPSTGEYAIACAAAGAVARKTFAGLAAIFPRIGNGRKVEIVILGGGTVYPDSLGDALAGVSGYANSCPFVRGTFTNATAGSVAFAGTIADVTFAGTQTATGLNAAGYHPDLGAGMSQFQLTKVGGGSPAFAVEPAVPLGWRVRFDAATATVALRNVCRQICRVPTVDTILLQTALPAAPANTDVCYLEMAGVVQSDLTLQGVTQTGIAGQGLTLVGILSTGTLTTSFGLALQMSLCGAASWVHTGVGSIVTQQAENHPVFSSVTFGGGFRSESSISLSNASAALAGCVSATDIILAENATPFTWADGCAARSISVIANTFGTGHSARALPNIGSNGPPPGVPHTFGADAAAAVLIDGSSCVFGSIDIINTGLVPCIKLSGKCTIVIKGLVNGTVLNGNMDVGLDLTDSTLSIVEVRSGLLPVLNGTSGDIRYASGALGVWTNLTFEEVYDQAGNRVFDGEDHGTAYTHTISPSVVTGQNLNPDGAMLAYTLVISAGGGSQPVQQASANALVTATGLVGVLLADVTFGALCLYGGMSGYKMVRFDSPPTAGAVAYLSKSMITPGTATTTVPPASATAAKLRLGIVVSNEGANLGVIRMNPELIPVLADGLP